MINKKLISELKKKKSVSTIYSLIKKIRQAHQYKITKEDAACILAGSLEIDIAKFIDKEHLERLRFSPTTVHVIETSSKQLQETIKLKVEGIKTDVPFLEKNIIKDCTNMARTISYFYLLENSIRFFILSMLDSKYPPKKWWNSKVPLPIRREVEKRMKKEKENRWHAKRGGHPIFYTNFGDLKRIIIENWPVFKFFFPDQHWISSRFNDLELSRNIIAHNNPLPKDEIGRIALYFKDWIKQVKESARS